MFRKYSTQIQMCCFKFKYMAAPWKDEEAFYYRYEIRWVMGLSATFFRDRYSYLLHVTLLHTHSFILVLEQMVL